MSKPLAARLTELAKEHSGRVVASEATVLAAAPEERAHWVRDGDVELRGRDETTSTWVRRRPGMNPPLMSSGRATR